MSDNSFMASQFVVTRDRESHAPAEAAPLPADDLRSTLTFCRTHPSDCGHRQIYVRLDDEAAVALLYGDAVTHEVKPGLHRLRVHNTLFWKTLKFAIEPGEHLECLVINRAFWWTYGMAGVLGAAPLFLRVRLNSLK
ncbi:MAG TPA: hypothetical protein VFV78_02730 [Vicinamibacterales bacterium]|nr:hypothetical protein [Vicinamibacterales bacterium]